MKNREINLFETHLKKHVAFAIFQLKVEQRIGGLIPSAKLNICF